MKLVGKERDGAKVRKQYDRAKTPYPRAVESGVVSTEERTLSEAALAKRGPLALRRQIEQELERPRDMATGKRPVAAAATG